MVFEIKVTQIYRTERSIKIQVEAEDRDSAIANVEAGEIELPAFEHPGWSENLYLQSEQVE